MRSDRGFTLMELLIAAGLAGILMAIALPVVMTSEARNGIWTGSEVVGAQIRQARLQAISRNTRYRVRFNCPAAGNLRVLVVTGTPAIDDAANRCTTYQQLDSGIISMPANVTFGTPPTLEVNGRGVYAAPGFAIPQTITVTNGTFSRNLTVSATGQIAFATF